MDDGAGVVFGLISMLVGLGITIAILLAINTTAKSTKKTAELLGMMAVDLANLRAAAEGRAMAQQAPPQAAPAKPAPRIERIQ